MNYGNIYEQLLMGRPFQAGVPGNPYAGAFADIVSQAQAFRRQHPRIEAGGTLASRVPGKPGAVATQTQYKRAALPTPRVFGGLING